MELFVRKEINEFLGLFKDVCGMIGIDVNFSIGEEDDLFECQVLAGSCVIQIEASYDYFYNDEESEENFIGLNFYIGAIDSDGEFIETPPTPDIPATWPEMSVLDLRLKHKKEVKDIHTILFYMLGGLTLHDPVKGGRPYALLINKEAPKGSFSEDKSKRLYHALIESDIAKENELFRKSLMKKLNPDGGKGLMNYFSESE